MCQEDDVSRVSMYLVALLWQPSRQLPRNNAVHQKKCERFEHSLTHSSFNTVCEGLLGFRWPAWGCEIVPHSNTGTSHLFLSQMPVRIEVTACLLFNNLILLTRGWHTCLTVRRIVKHVSAQWKQKEDVWLYWTSPRSRTRISSEVMRNFCKYKFYVVVFHFYIFFKNLCYHTHVEFRNKNMKYIYSSHFFLPVYFFSSVRYMASVLGAWQRKEMLTEFCLENQKEIHSLEYIGVMTIIIFGESDTYTHTHTHTHTYIYIYIYREARIRTAFLSSVLLPAPLGQILFSLSCSQFCVNSCSFRPNTLLTPLFLVLCYFLLL